MARGPSPPMVFDELPLPAVGPELAAGGDVVGGDDFLATALLDGEGAAIGRDKRRVAKPDWLLPHQR